MPKGYKVRKAKASQISKRPDPKVDTILCNLGEDIEGQKEVETEGLVTVRIPSDNSSRGDMPIELNLNGRNYRIDRDRTCTIPKEIAQILKNSSKYPITETNPSKTQIDETGKYIVCPETSYESRFNLIIERED